MIKVISRSEEAAIPNFTNNKEAEAWFKNHYGNALMYVDRYVLSDNNVYYLYHLVLDRNAYLAGVKKLSKGENISGTEFLSSHQPIEIFEDGRIHIVY